MKDKSQAKILKENGTRQDYQIIGDSEIDLGKCTIINPKQAVRLVGIIAKRMKKAKAVPDYVILVGTEAFVLNVPVSWIFERVLGKAPFLLTPVLPNFASLRRFKRGIAEQLKMHDAAEDAVYLILDVSATNGGTLLKAKVALEKMAGKKAKVYTAVLASMEWCKTITSMEKKNPCFGEDNMRADLKEGFIKKEPDSEKKVEAYLLAYVPDFVGRFTPYDPMSSWVKETWIGASCKRGSSKKIQGDGTLYYSYVHGLVLHPKDRKKRTAVMKKLTRAYLKKLH